MDIKSNIVKLYIIKLSKWFMLFMPIVALFYDDNGLSEGSIFQLQGIYSFTIVILEIPSGYFADVLGRKTTLVFGTILGFLGFMTYSFSYGFLGFLFAEILLGLGQSLVSGADSAMLYDSLLDMHKEKEYSKHEGKLTATGNFAEAIAAIVGGLLAEVSLRWPYYGQTVVAFIGIPAALFLMNPTSHIPLKRAKLNDFFKIMHYSLFEHKQIRNNLLLSSIIGTATLSMAWFTQIYFKEMEFDKALIGVLWTALNLIVGLVSWQAYKVEKKIGAKSSILFISLAIPMGYILVGITESIMGLIIIFLFYAVRGYATPVLKDYVNKITPSQTRATVLSIRSFLIRLIFAMLSPLLGYVTNSLSLFKALILAGIIFIVGSLLASIMFLKHLKFINEK